MGLGEKILQLRKANGLSQEQLAEMLNVSRQAISKWETDQSAPEIEKVLLLSKTFSFLLTSFWETKPASIRISRPHNLPT